MLSEKDFIDYVLNDPNNSTVKASKTQEAVLPQGFEGFEGFDTTETPLTATSSNASFARRLLEASGFGLAEIVARDNVIRSTAAVARHLPERLFFWPKTPSRPYRTLLFETELNHKQLLSIPAFKTHKLTHLDRLEDALARLVGEALKGFQKGGQGVTADVRKGCKEETLCVVSVLDGREGEKHPVRLVCFGTWNKSTEGLETFLLTEQTRFWESQLAREHLKLLYRRQFRKLETANWQEAFTSTDERKQAKNLLDICTDKQPEESEIQAGVLSLLDTIAKNFGLQKPANRPRLQAFTLPPDHDSGIDSEERERSFGGKNPFGGVTLRDEWSRLLGYIVYPLKSKSDALRLREHLEKNNRFHNVLVVYPDEDQASLELWQGREQLVGKLRKGQGYKDAADVVNLLSRFFVVSKAKVRNPTELAQELAYRARYLRRLAVKQLEDEPEKGPLRNLYNAFKEALVHDQTEEEFADAFAQTLTYSLLTARWVLSAQSDGNISDRFSRKAALQRLSLGSRFLGEMFTAVLAMKLADRTWLLWLVDDIADLLDRINVKDVFKSDGTELTKDPVIYFYETFLQEYDPKIRMQRGAFYTPQPVVSYIVRSVHEMLQTEFGLIDGLADTTTWGQMLKKHPSLKLPPVTDEPDEKTAISPDEPFVQVLDPATGTATFLVEVIDVVHRTLMSKWEQQGLSASQRSALWNDYVPKHLLPRLHGFELMMAPYAIAHMKIGMKFAETGYHFHSEERARIYLTNALEPWVKQLPLIGFDALANEAANVNTIKRQGRFTVVIGNPPYSGFSSNEGTWIEQLMERYKTTVRGEERQIQRLSNDYVKFMRFSEFLVGEARIGCLGFITDSGYLNGILFRDMRAALRSTFQSAWIHNLHGVAMRGAARHVGIDENVFDITQGVAIVLLVRTGSTVGRFHYADLIGSRRDKYAVLSHSSASKTRWKSIIPSAPKWFFVPVQLDQDYQAWPLFTEIIGSGAPKKDRDSRYGTGIKTRHDEFAVGWSTQDAVARVKQVAHRSEADSVLIKKLGLCTTAHFSIGNARKRAEAQDLLTHVNSIAYRPFDWRSIVYLREFICEPKTEIMRHMLHSTNVAMAVLRRNRKENGAGFFVARGLIAKDLVSNLDDALVWPLYLVDGDDNLFKRGRKPIGLSNIAMNFATILTTQLGFKWLEYGNGDLTKSIGPEDIFHYIYAVFHSPGYRSRYAEFLKIDFPRLPLIDNPTLFRALARLGGELVSLHLMESKTLDRPITSYEGPENPDVVKIGWSSETVWIDAKGKKGLSSSGSVGFKGVSESVWNFHIGGYQVCEKWLKDRKGRHLEKNDITHYQKIVVAISETIRIMKEIDEVIDDHGGWPGAFVTKSTEGNQ